MSSYQYRKSHCGDKTVVRSSYLHNGISYTGKMSSLYWIGAQGETVEQACHETIDIEMKLLADTWHLCTRRHIIRHIYYHHVLVWNVCIMRPLAVCEENGWPTVVTHWIQNVILTKCSSMVASREVVILRTFGAASAENIAKIMIFTFQCTHTRVHTPLWSPF